MCLGMHSHVMGDLQQRVAGAFPKCRCWAALTAALLPTLTCCLAAELPSSHADRPLPSLLSLSLQPAATPCASWTTWCAAPTTCR